VPLTEFDQPPGTRVALVSHGGKPLAQLDTGVPVTYVLGAEREGLPDDVVAACDVTVTIPLADDAESLNVAVAAAIALYEHRRGS
jgi:TrmH family RNA methyltransferase